MFFYISSLSCFIVKLGKGNSFMKVIVFTTGIFLMLLLLSCSRNISKNGDETKIGEGKSKNLPETQAAIRDNQSIVTAEVEGIYPGDKGDFFIKAKILKIEENPAYTSMAVQGASYVLVPSFQLDINSKVIDNDRNRNLSKMKSLKAGDTFKAVIFYVQYKGWHIDKFL